MSQYDRLSSKIIAARPEDVGNALFVSETMGRVREQSSRETFSQVLRRTNVTKKERLFMKLRSLSTASLVALAMLGVITVSGTAYAAYTLFSTIVTVKDYDSNNDDNKRQYTLDVKNCGIVRGGTPIGNGTQVFEVARNSTLQEQEIIKVVKDTCEYQAMNEFVDKQWPKMATLNYKKGDVLRSYDYVPAGQYNIGIVTEKNDASITIKTTVYEAAPDSAESINQPLENVHYAEGKVITTTMALAKDAVYFHNQQPVSAADISIGDTVRLATVNELVASKDSPLPGTPEESSEWAYADPRNGTTSVLGIIKADFDTRYVQEFGVGDPKLVAPIVKLVGCQTHKNKDLMCVTTNSPNLRFTTVYAVESLNELQEGDTSAIGGEKYFRTDITNDKIGDTTEEVEGRVVSIQDKKITIRSRSNDAAKIFNVTFPYDVVSAHNEKSETHLQVGDYVELYYNQFANEDSLEVKPGDITRLNYLNYLQPDGSLVKY